MGLDTAELSQLLLGLLQARFERPLAADGMAGVHRFGDRLERRELGAPLAGERARHGQRLLARGRAVVPDADRVERRQARRVAGGRHGDGGGRVLQDLPRVVADEGPLELVAPRGPDHEQVTMSADGLMKAAGHRACLDGQQLRVGVRIVSHRGEPLQRAPAVVELPLGVGVRAG